MTRATRAKWLAGTKAAIVVQLVAVFAALRNKTVLKGAAPAPASAAEAGAMAPLSTAARGPTSAGVDATRLARGRSAYDRLQCAACHSIAGRGNLANPLDGVGTRLDRSALRDFATGTGAAQGSLGTSLARRNSRALEDPELEALLDYLAQLK